MGLFVVAGFAALAICSHQMLIVVLGHDPKDAVVVGIFRCMQGVELFMCVATFAVALLRTRESPLARPTTTAVSILLALWVPFGTVVFFWWLIRVRRQERGSLP